MRKLIFILSVYLIGSSAHAIDDWYYCSADNGKVSVNLSYKVDSAFFGAFRPQFIVGKTFNGTITLKERRTTIDLKPEQVKAFYSEYNYIKIGAELSAENGDLVDQYGSVINDFSRLIFSIDTNQNGGGAGGVLFVETATFTGQGVSYQRYNALIKCYSQEYPKID